MTTVEPLVHPLVALLIGVAIVVGGIVALRAHAFLALTVAAIAVSVLGPGALDQTITRVAAAFGATAGSIGIVIALAAVVGQCMMVSGAADRIVRAFVGLLGERRGAAALCSSGFVLSVPVFFDTVFYLLVPLARSMYRRTRGRRLRYLLAVATGGVITHTLVPPTPGPLFVAGELGVDLGAMMVAGIAVAVPSAIVGLWFAAWCDARVPVGPPPDAAGGDAELAEVADDALPPLWLSVLPLVLPVAMITAHTITKSVAGDPPGEELAGVLQWTAVVGNPNLALLVSAAFAIGIVVRQRRPSRTELARHVESALMSAGVIILITAAGGAFGAMLKTAGVGDAIQELFAGGTAPRGLAVLGFGFGLSALLKFAQGSSTVAMITAAGMLGAMLDTGQLGFHPAYLGLAIGSGSLVGSWMNDSGFWIFARMGGLTEVEALASWTPLLAVLGCTGMLATGALALLFPFAGG